MYTKTFESKRIRIRNDHYRKLLKRFDINSFVRETRRSCSVSYTVIRNDVSCALCDAFFNNFNDEVIAHRCFGCSFDTFKSHGCTGCAYVLNQLLPPSRLRHLIIDQNYVAYSPMYTTNAINELAAVYDFLKSFKKE